MTKRVLVTGSRDWDNYQVMFDQLESVAWSMSFTPYDITEPSGEAPTLIQGGARGADSMAAGIWCKFGQVQTYNANWNACKGKNCTPAHRKRNAHGSYCPTAGFDRNEYMVGLNPDICLAFFKTGAGNKGTKHCADLARKAGIEVVEIWG